MKSAPLLLLLSSVLLLPSHLLPASGRRLLLPGGFHRTQRTERVLFSAGEDGFVPGTHMVRLLHRRNPELLHLLENQEEEEEQEEKEEQGEALLKRSDEAPLSIDLTFHLLRNMIHLAQVESQRAQAQLNRKVLDEVGK